MARGASRTILRSVQVKRNGEALTCVRRLTPPKGSQGICHAGADMSVAFSVLAIRNERVGLAHLLNRDRRYAGMQRAVHRLDEFIGYDRVSGVRRMNAIHREKPSHEVGRQFLAAD